ncbi:prolipoprotein diacylglyceryl transferase [Kaarinaea lacus]
MLHFNPMLTFPELNPIAFEIGPLQVHWYGLMYLVGFAGGWWLGMVRARQCHCGWTPEQVTDGLFYVALGVVLGGRVGFTVFYAWEELLADPWLLFRMWEGGMSFHGGFLGVLLGMWWFARKHRKKFFEVMDFVAPLVTIGLGAGRLGNFINGELWGRVTDVPWGMVFPGGGPLPRHPSQLYEFLLEGVVLFFILWIFSAKPRPRMAVSGLFALCYGIFRFLVEFVRQPDAYMGDGGFIAFGWLTMGQLLSLPMILVGMALLWWAYHRKPGQDGGTNTPKLEPSNKPLNNPSSDQARG